MHIWILGLVRRLRIRIMLSGGFTPHVAAYIAEAGTAVIVHRSFTGTRRRIAGW
jgi:hypothetical protein